MSSLITDTQNHVSLLIETVDFAAKKHKSQKRKDIAQTPYINHPIGVARILTLEGGVTDLNVIQAALLHDTVEDTNTTFEEIEEIFGRKIRDIVYEVTDDKTLPKLERKRLQIEHAPHCTYEAKLVKLADKLYNLRDLMHQTPRGWTKERVNEYFVWASKVVARLRGTNKELESSLDLLFRKRGVVTD
ncbi:guanosine-3',5'-bis(diphosphate) 3'-pyrophosphohydrolase MESH1-like [Limulus polyphemus]|uniref:Guanosine-3',5'-bis(diphosphate) 3'-pyrophosphohydrolase MESH1 n=1 Tax=Limulus polyphemus TaxID=6850 RepID=A0ABM1BMG2_LIMPO|nr:guanosine-3',5'-bis(diphosphate) 3'-pyrophosphohydrolase MESH1-like [Limulus polyphemus]